MQCEKVREKLAEYDLGEEGAEIEEHLRSCAACREELEALRRADGLLRGLSAPAAPEGLWARVEPRLTAREATTGRTSRRWLWWPAFGTVAAAAAIVVALLVPRPEPFRLPQEVAEDSVLFLDRQVVTSMAHPHTDRLALLSAWRPAVAQTEEAP